MIAIIAGLITFWVVPAPEPCSLQKRESKELAALFGDTYEVEAIPVMAVSAPYSDVLREGDCIRAVYREGSVAGYLLSTSAKGRFDYFDYSVIYSKELTVVGLLVTVYRSEHGAGICQKKWLEQFVGYAGGELTIGKEIDAVSGGTISSTSMVNDIQRCQQLMVKLRESGLIS